MRLSTQGLRHCEQPRDEAIHAAERGAMDCFASLAMTTEVARSSMLELDDHAVARRGVIERAEPFEHVVAHMRQDQPLRRDLRQMCFQRAQAKMVLYDPVVGVGFRNEEIGVVKNHLSLSTLEAHLPEIAAKRLILTHMSDDMLGRLGSLRHLAASDGMIVEL